MTDLRRYDLCIKPMGAADAKSSLLSSSSCSHKGLGYKEVSTLFPLQAGAYDFKVIEAGATCDGAGVTTLSPAIVEESKPVAFYLLGDGQTKPTLARFAESRPASPIALSVRYLHAAPNVPARDAGVAASASLPTELLLKVFPSVPFGSVAPPSPGNPTIDANGYTDLTTGGGVTPIGSAAPGTTTVELTIGPDFKTSHAYTVFAVGNPSLPAFPTQLHVCDETASVGILAKCGVGIAQDLVVDAYNAQLTGPFAPSEKARKPALPGAIAGLGGDVACIAEVWSDADKLAIVDAAKATYPHAYWKATTLDTPVDDPKDASGVVPPAFTTPACSGSSTKLNAAIDCIRDNCATPKADESGVFGEDAVTPTSCLQSKCLGPVVSLFGSASEADRTCWSCILTGLFGYEKMGDLRAACSTDPKARFVRGGANGMLVLSRFPLKNPETWVLPATEWRVAVLRAPVSLPNAALVDVYCTALTTPASSSTRPYAGQYGGGATSAAVAWANELSLQTKKLVDFVRARSGPTRRRAIIAGDPYSGPSFDDGAGHVLKARFPDSYALLSAAFASGLAPGALPMCTQCGDNPWYTAPGMTPAVDSTWTTSIYLSDIPLIDVHASSIGLTEATIPFDAPSGAKKVPPSSYYAFRSVIRVEP